MVIGLAGCTPHPAGPAPGPTGPDPAAARACHDARAVINQSTDQFTRQVNAAVAAADAGDPAAQAAAFDQVRSTFAQWSARLRAVADTAGTAELSAVLIEYAGAVDATIARVTTVADLDRLSSFDDQELDTVSSRLAQLCGDG